METELETKDATKEMFHRMDLVIGAMQKFADAMREAVDYSIQMAPSIYEILSSPEKFERVARKNRHRSRYYKMVARMQKR